MTELTLVMPGAAAILGQEINQEAIPTYLKKLLLKANTAPLSDRHDRCVFNHFAQQSTADTDLPLASIETGLPNAIKVTPCYLHADRDRLLLFHAGLKLTEAENQALHHEISPLLDEIGALTDDGHLVLKDEINIQFTALEEVEGQAIDQALPSGKDRKQWIRLWNEIQMQLHDAPFNQRRTERQQLPINSVWFWGQGEYQSKGSGWQSITGQSQLLQNLAVKSDLGHVFKTQRRLIIESGQHLRILDPVDPESDWRSQLLTLDEAIFKPCWQALSTMKLKHLTLQVPGLAQYTVTPRQRWQFW